MECEKERQLKDRITPHVTNFFRLRLIIEKQEGKRKYMSDGAVMVGEFVCMYVCSCTVSEWVSGVSVWVSECECECECEWVSECVCESCYHMQAETHIHTYFNPWSESRAGDLLICLSHGSIHQSVANEATDVWRGYAVWSTARTCESNCWFLFLYDAVCFKKEFHISYCLLYCLH